MSKLINKSSLQQFATKLWTKIKERYDDAFINAEITTSTDTEKKIKFTKKKGGATVDVNLVDYARLQDRNEFEKDVSVDNAGVVNNLHLGNVNGNTSRDRILGHRNITSKLFVDGYVSDLVIFASDALNNGISTSWRIWAIKKGVSREQDTVFKTYHSGNTLKTANIETVTLDGLDRKVVKFAINEKFTEEVYFMVQCSNQDIKVIHPTGSNLNDDVINLSERPSDTSGATIQWGTNATNNTAIMYLYGRESIGSLSEKLRQTQSDSSLYVKHSETTTTGGNGEGGKVVKLDSNGKLNSNMLPSMAIGEYFEINEFTDSALQRLDHYENGDTVVVTGATDTGARYLCINKGGSNLTNLTDAFIKLNDKDGVVTSVNGVTGAVTLKIEATTNKLQLKVNNEMKSEVEIISDSDIDTIINGLS